MLGTDVMEGDILVPRSTESFPLFCICFFLSPSSPHDAVAMQVLSLFLPVLSLS